MNTFILLKFSNSAWRADNKEGKTLNHVRATTIKHSKFYADNTYPDLDYLGYNKNLI